jgi:hypothetical protein
VIDVMLPGSGFHVSPWSRERRISHFHCWPVIYDGRGFRTPLARQYERTAWETNFVVAIDGISGKVIDTKLQINTKLAEAVAKLLE